MADSKLASPSSQIEEGITCCMCRVQKAKNVMTQVKKENCVTGQVEQWRCTECNQQRGKVYRLCKATLDFATGYKTLNAEERSDFYKKSSGLCGAQLAKMLRTLRLSKTSIR